MRTLVIGLLMVTLLGIGTLPAQALAPTFPHYEAHFMSADTVPSKKSASASRILEGSATGALIGAVFGALSGFVPICTLSQEPEHCIGTNILLFSVAGAAIGAIVGAESSQ